uniref:uncharacterized protein LOC131110207 n=1 Tax=Doryrhamphus excisus TaxID=161450 RepID=UPI0025AE243F|nr:uncharacterized protein LOC131110207 [Doryrhamphus excisus]XP_057919044.1 uncharacterized protein LOC131110207 [Doryrhamphus excisus]XP_057919045.1 uncharacterized protein LOC131110207 [Doryrhamphus excisus]
MWCYQKPGFEALLVAELQRQQQRRQFCDTLLRAEGVSVPAHGCVLSAISPQLSTVLPSSAAPPSGQKHVVEFGSMGARTLLHLVKLLYSGEMAGEGESEKQQAVSAAAKLGILDLVEVTQRRRGQRSEVGVQTDPVELRDGNVLCVRWSQEVGDGDGSSVPWKDTNAERNVQAGGGQVSDPLHCHAVPTYETIDLAQFQTLGHMDVIHPVVPVSVIHPQDGNQWTADFPAGLHAGGRDILEGDVGGDEQFEQYHDNIPGFINHFLNLDHKEAGQTRRKQRGARRAAAKKPRRPRGPRGGRGWMQTVDVQDVNVSKRHKSLLQRCGMAASVRAGQGGGATGRKLYLKTRHILCSGRGSQTRRGRGAGWDFSPDGDQMGGGSFVMRRTNPECKKVSPAAPRTPAALSHPAPPPHDDPPENLDRLLDEVMRGLNVMASSSAPDSQPQQQQQQQRHPGATTVVVSTGRTGDSRSDGEAGRVDPQVEGDLTAMLEDFLQSLEPRGDSCVVRVEERHRPPQRKRNKATPSATQSAPPHGALEGVRAAGKRSGKKRHPQNERKRIPYSVSDIINKIVAERGDECLRHLPVVKLERRGVPAVNTSSQTVSCQAVKEAPDTPAGSTKIYPIRSRCKRAPKKPLPAKPPPSRPVRQSSRLRKITPLSPVAPTSGTKHGNLMEKNEDRRGSKATEEDETIGAVRRSLKRSPQPDEETTDVSGETKKKRLKRNDPPPSRTSTSDETVLQASQEEAGVTEQNEELSNMGEHLEEGSCPHKTAPCLPPSPEVKAAVPGSEEEEEDVDVIGTCDSTPDPVVITWSPCPDSEGTDGDEEIDVIGVSDFALAMSNAVDRMYHAEVPLR